MDYSTFLVLKQTTDCGQLANVLQKEHCSWGGKIWIVIRIRLALEQHYFHICGESIANNYCQQLLPIEVVIVVDIFGTGWAALTINLRNAGLLQWMKVSILYFSKYKRFQTTITATTKSGSVFMQISEAINHVRPWHLSRYATWEFQTGFGQWSF